MLGVEGPVGRGLSGIGGVYIRMTLLHVIFVCVLRQQPKNPVPITKKLVVD